MTKQERKWANIEKKRDDACRRVDDARICRDRISEEEFCYLIDSIGLSKIACVTGYCCGGVFHIYIEVGGKHFNYYGKITIRDIEFMINKHKDLPWFLDFCAYRNLPCDVGSKDISEFTPRMYKEAQSKVLAPFDGKSEYEMLCQRIKEAEEEQ